MNSYILYVVVITISMLIHIHTQIKFQPITTYFKKNFNLNGGRIYTKIMIPEVERFVQAKLPINLDSCKNSN